MRIFILSCFLICAFSLAPSHTATAQKAQPGAVADQDNDGVPDSEDLCPTVAGPASNKGCPTDAIAGKHQRSSAHRGKKASAMDDDAGEEEQEADDTTRIATENAAVVTNKVVSTDEYRDTYEDRHNRLIILKAQASEAIKIYAAARKAKSPDAARLKVDARSKIADLIDKSADYISELDKFNDKRWSTGKLDFTEAIEDNEALLKELK